MSNLLKNKALMDRADWESYGLEKNMAGNYIFPESGPIRDRMKQDAISKIAMAKRILVLEAPFFAYLRNSLITKVFFPDEKNVNTARCVSGKKIEYNVIFVLQLTLKELCCVDMHETLHAALGHCFHGKKNPLIHNLACDYVVNGMIYDFINVNNKKWDLPKHFKMFLHSQYYGKTSDFIYNDLLIRIKDLFIKNNYEEEYKYIINNYFHGIDVNSKPIDITNEKNEKSPDEVFDFIKNLLSKRIKKKCTCKNNKNDLIEKLIESIKNNDIEDEKNTSLVDSVFGKNEIIDTRYGKDIDCEFHGIELSNEIIDVIDSEDAVDRVLFELLSMLENDMYESDSDAFEKINKKWLERLMQASGIAKRYGKGHVPSGIQGFIDDFMTPVVDWKTYLKNMKNEVCKDDYNWNVPNKYYLNHGFYLPSLHGKTLGNICVFVDVSGSCTEYIKQFISEAFNIFTTFKNVNVKLMEIDAEVQKVIDWKKGRNFPLIEGVEVSGGGGTSFVPPFEYIREHNIKPKLIIYLTDLDGEIPDNTLNPNCPVLWICVNDRHDQSELAFGKLLNFELK